MKSYSTLLDDTITATMVKQYVYCPIIPWLQYYFNYDPPITPSMERGKEITTPEFKEEVAKRLGLPRPYRLEQPVYYKPLKLRGVVDVIAGTSKLTILEVKSYRRKRKWINHFLAQLITYAYIVEKTMGPVHKAILYHGGDIIEIRPTLGDYERIKQIINKIRKTLKREEPPQTQQPPSKCNYCEYNKLCPAKT